MEPALDEHVERPPARMEAVDRRPQLHSLAYDLLERLGYSCLTPRPLHEKSDPAAIEHFKANAPLL